MNDKITNVELDEFLTDYLKNSETILLEESKENDDIMAVAKAKGYILKGSNDLAGFKTIYTFDTEANVNKARLPKELLLKALPGIIGKPVDIDHNRIYVVGHYIDYKYIAAKHMVIAYGVFYKSNFGEEWAKAKQLFAAGKLGTSYEIWCSKAKRKYLPDGTYVLMSIEIAGGGLMFKEKPAFPNALCLELSMKKNFEDKMQDLVFASAKKYDETELFISKLDSTVCDTKMCTADFIGRHVDELIGKPISTALPAGDKVEVADKIGKPIIGMPKPGTTMGLSQDKTPKQGTDLVKLAQDNALKNTGVQPARLNNDNLGDNISQPGPQIVACANCKAEFSATPQTFQRKNSIDFYECSNADNLHQCPGCKAIVAKTGEMKYPPQNIDFNLNCPNCTSRNWRLLKNAEDAADVKCMGCNKNYNLAFAKPETNPMINQLSFMREGRTSCPQCQSSIPYSTTSAVDTKQVTCPKCNLHFGINLKKASNQRKIERANEFISQEDNQQIGDGGGQSSPSYSGVEKSSIENPETAKLRDKSMKNQPVKGPHNQQITDVMAKQDATPDNKETKQLATPNKPVQNYTGALYLVRHGKTSLNNDDKPTDDKIRGWKNIPLNNEGRLQAKEVGQIFKGHKIDKLYSSDLSRAYDTANEISKTTGTPIDKKFDLRPWNLGKHQGQSSAVVGPKIADSVTKTPHIKIEGGESFNNFKSRALNMARKLIEEAKTKKVVAVTHTRDLKLIQAWIKAGCPDDNSFDEKHFMSFGKTVHTGSIHKIVPTDKGAKITEIENLNKASIDNDTTVSSIKEGENTNMETKPEEIKEVPTAEIVTPVVDETPAEDTTVADVEDAEVLEQEEALEVSKTLKAEDRNALDNSKFAVVKTVKDKKTGGTRTIRKYPIHDKAHVQNALARLHQSPSREGLEKLGVNPDSVITKVKAAGKKMGMETAEMEGYCVSSKGRDMQEVVKRGPDNVQEKSPANPNNYVGAKIEEPISASKESTPNVTIKTSKVNKVKTGDSAVQGLTPDQVNQMQNQLFANMDKAKKLRKAHKMAMKNVSTLKKAMEMCQFASVQEVDVVMNMNFTSPGKTTTVDNRGTGEKVSEGVVTGDQAGLTPVKTQAVADVQTEAKTLADDLKPATIGDFVDVIKAPATPCENCEVPSAGKETTVDNRGTGEKVSEAVAGDKGTGCATNVPSLTPGATQDTAVNTKIDGKGSEKTPSFVDEKLPGGTKSADSFDTIVRAQVETLEKENESLKLKIQELEAEKLKITERRNTLGEFAKDLSDKDILDDGKFEVAKQKAEQAKLKLELNKSSEAVAEIVSTTDDGTLKKLKAEIDSKASKMYGK